MDVSPASSEPDLSQQALKKLILEVGDLQRRVVNLERRVGVAVPLSASAVTSVPTALPELRLSAEAVPTLGKALLGIAGAYLLRALTEIGALPQAAGVAAGIAYAAVWLSLAGRTHAQRRLVITVYASTSMLILAPLLWEATFRLNVISSWMAAAVVTAFALIAQALSWRKKVTALFGIAAVSSALIAMVLMVAKHDLLPFTLAILMIAAGMEATAYYDHPARWLVAGMADLSILIFSVLISLKGGLPEGYAPTSLRAALITQAILLVIYVAGTAARTLVRDRSITSGEIAQTAQFFSFGTNDLTQGISELHSRSRCSHLPLVQPVT